MKPSRFVTLCFLYSGAVLLVTQTIVYRPDLRIAVVGNAATALCILFVGVYRLYSEQEENRPEEYGVLTYGMALFSLLITILLLVGLSLR